MTTAERTLSGQSRWVWLRLGINYVTIGIGRVYDVDSILATFYEPALKPVNFMAVYGLSITCQFLIPYQLYNGNYYTIRYDTRCYFNVRSKADISRLNLPHGGLIYPLLLRQWHGSLVCWLE